jgi:hypothetical protein
MMETSLTAPESPICDTIARKPRAREKYVPRMKRVGGKRNLSIHASLVLEKQKSSIAGFIKGGNRPSFNLREMLNHKCQESRRRFSSVSALTLDSSIFSIVEAEQVEGATKPRNSTVDLGLFDVEEQRKQMEYYEEISRQSEVLGCQDPAWFEDNDEAPVQEEDASGEENEESEVEDSMMMIEVAPGLKLPLRSSGTCTWDAIMEGRITVTKCTCCGYELACIDDANLVVCGHCWVFSPVDQNMTSLFMEVEDPKSRLSVGMGVRMEGIFEWLSDQEKMLVEEDKEEAPGPKLL